MTQILAFIAGYMEFLWVGARHRIVNSEVATSFGGDACLIVESKVLRLRFVSDRGQLFLDVQPVGELKDWYSIDLVRRLLTGRPEHSAALDQEYASFLRNQLDDIERRFSKEAWPRTQQELKTLKARRSKEMFG